MAPAQPILRAGDARSALTQSTAVRRLTGSVFLTGAALITPAYRALDVPLGRGIPVIVTGFIAALIVLSRATPVVGTRANHLLLIAAYGIPMLALYGALPHAAPIASAFTFTGALVAFRLTRHREIAAHIGATVALLVLPLVLGVADAATVVAVAVLIPAIIALAVIVSIVIDAAERQSDELARLTRRDPLTGAGNRRLLSERLEYELHRHARAGLPFSLIALDLNGFKQVNDTLGHAAGDELLIAVASTLEAGVRSGDTVVRQGGDEFCVLLPETTVAEATKLGAQLRIALGEIVTGHQHLSTGLGFAEFPADGRDVDGLLRVADDRLRDDKSGLGRAAGRAA